MADKPAAAAGMYSSALPDKPLRRNTIDPEALSASEGSGQGVPACSHAWPEAQPLIGVVRNDSTTSRADHVEKQPLGPLALALAKTDMWEGHAGQTQANPFGFGIHSDSITCLHATVLSWIPDICYLLRIH